MSIFQDIRHAFRQFRRAPAVTGIAVLSIALTTGAVAIVFTAVKTVLIEPFPFARPHELVTLGTGFPRAEASYAEWDLIDLLTRLKGERIARLKDGRLHSDGTEVLRWTHSGCFLSMKSALPE